MGTDAGSRTLRAQQARMMIVVSSGATALLIGCSSMPSAVMPDGKHRVPVNTAARIEAFQERLEEMRGYEADRTRWVQEVNELRNQVAQLRSATIILAANAEERAGTPSTLTRGTPGAGVASIGSMHSMPITPPAALANVDAAQPTATLQPAERAAPTLRPVAAAPAHPPSSMPSHQAQPVRLTGAAPGVVRVRVIASPEAAADAQPDATPAGARPPPAEPTRLDFESNQLEIGVPRPVPPPKAPERLDTLAEARGASGETFSFPSVMLARGFAPEPAQAAALTEAARRSGRIVIRSSVTAEAGDRTSLARAHDRANEARTWLVGQGIEAARIYVATTRREPQGGDLVKAIQIRIDTEGPAPAPRTTTAAAAAPVVSPARALTSDAFGLTQISVGVQ